MQLGSTTWGATQISRCASPNFTQQQVAQLVDWKIGHEEWNVQIIDSGDMDSEMIVVELPPYLDIDGLGLNLQNWVIYPAAEDAVRVLFWGDHESHYPALDAALKDIGLLRACRT